MKTFDTIVIGGGPGGLSAAIRSAAAGRHVLVIERREGTLDGPGETLHPGIEPIFEQLGVKKRMIAMAAARHPGIIIERGDKSEPEPYGPGWLGFQIRRQVLNKNLEDQLKSLGGVHIKGCRATGLDTDTTHHVVETSSGVFKARWIFDASGSAGWLDRRMGIQSTTASGPIWLRYGYDEAGNADGDMPRLQLKGDRWSWRATLDRGQVAWVDGSLQSPIKERKPNSTGSDGTWRLSETPSQNRCFRIGDAACRLDPTNGKGVLRAMMSAIMAERLSRHVDDGEIDASNAHNVFNSWIRDWFTSDYQQLRALNIESGMTQSLQARL